MRVFFIYFNAFSFIGGIQTFNRALLKAADELDSEEVFEFKTLSLYDSEPDEKYIRKSLFKSSNANKIKFSFSCVYEALSSDLVILGHVNLSPIGFIIKKLLRKKVVIIAHGTDVWFRMSKIRETMLRMTDGILSVSKYTKQKLVDVHTVEPSNIDIFYNTLDPYFQIPDNFDKPKYLMDKIGINDSNKVLLTVARLSSEEKYKGYDTVLRALPEVLKEFPETIYVIVGSGDKEEVSRVEALVLELNLTNNVVLPGFVSNEDLTAYYLLSDLFIMPSKGEGFGIVFLEALVCGNTIVVGNKDASREAILDGEIGIILDPDDVEEISSTIVNVFKGNIRKELRDKNYMRKRSIEKFGFDKYKERLKNFIQAH